MNELLIKNMKEENKPRERLIKYGKEILSNEELLSIILRCGTKNISVKELSCKIINSFNLREVNINNLSSVKGVGKVKAITLIAALELGKRVYYEETCNRYSIKNTKDIYELLKYKLVYEKQENFYVVLLDTKNNVLDYKLMFTGTLNVTSVHPREIYKYAIDNLAASIIVVHNHPSGDVSPSKPDIDITNRLNSLGEILGIKLLDHVIISKNAYYSFYEINKNKN